MDNSTNISRRAIVLAAAIPPVAAALPVSRAAAQAPQSAEMTIMIRIREMSRELSYLLNGLPHAHRLTIEPSGTAVYPVLMEDMNPGLMPDHLAMMNRGLAVMERGAKMHDPSITGLGLLWSVDDGVFGGVAVNYSQKVGA